jgi:ABC-type multidrug transport system ATPase subunit
LVFRNICYEITGNSLGSSSSSTVSRKRVLRGIYGCVKPGEMMAIMGSSGAGKTTCLDILAGKPKKGIVTGNLYINNKTPTRAEFKKITGYVDQEDSLLPTLTVYETLLCSALLRLPRSMSYEMKVRRVRDVLAELGIEHIANNRVGGSSSLSSFFSSSGSGGGGDNGSSSRGLSGGERRRVSIALETIPSPSLLYLDEPTSGLDSYNAFSVVYNLKKLAVNYGRTIVLSLHQPRSDIFNMFDRLLLLGEGGYMVYSGRL